MLIVNNVKGGEFLKFFFSKTIEPNLTFFITNHLHGKSIKNVTSKVKIGKKEGMVSKKYRWESLKIIFLKKPIVP